MDVQADDDANGDQDVSRGAVYKGLLKTQFGQTRVHLLSEPVQGQSTTLVWIRKN